MLTVFAIPKPFRGHIGIIQNNAIRSWTRLRPDYEIILFGNDEGTAEIAAELGIKHVPEVEYNEYGTPLINSMLDIAQDIASYEILCWINADIILLSDFPTAVEQAITHVGRDPYLLIGRRWNIDLKEEWDFSNADWEAHLRAYAESVCRQRIPVGMDYYIFPRGLFRNLPPFAVGRLSASNWMVYQVLSQGVPVIDVTYVATAIHQRHDYAHQQNVLGEEAAQADNVDPLKAYNIISMSPEAERNRQLAGGKNPIFSPLDVTWILTKSGSLRQPPRVRRLYHRLFAYRVPAPFPRVHLFRPPLRAFAALVRALRAVKGKPKARFL